MIIKLTDYKALDFLYVLARSSWPGHIMAAKILLKRAKIIGFRPLLTSTRSASPREDISAMMGGENDVLRYLKIQ